MKKIFSLFAAVLFAGSMMAETTTVFSWDGNGQTAAITPQGGTVAAQGGDANVVAGSKQKNNWCFKLGKTYMVESVPTHYVEITLSTPLQGGESIEIGAFVADATKNAILGINFDGNNELTESSEDGSVNRLTENGVPTSFTKTVPADAAGATTIRLYRQSGGTTPYVSKFVITRENTPTSDWDGTVTLSKETITSIADLEGITLTFNGAATLAHLNEEADIIALQNANGSEMYAAWHPDYGGTYTINGNVVTLNNWFDNTEVAPLPSESATLYFEDYGSFMIDGVVDYFETAEIAYEAAPATTYTVTYTVNGFDEEYCSVYACYYNVGFDNVTFVDGANTVPENMLAYISTVVIDGYTVEVKVDGEVVTLTNGNWQSEITADMTIEVTFAAPGETTSTSETIKYSNFVQDDATATSYQNFTYASTSGATYKAHMMLQNGKDSLQIRSTQTASTYYAGIVNTVAPQGKYIKSVSVEWHSGTADTRQLNIFTVDAPMAINDMYAQSATPNYTTLKSAGDKKIEVEGKHSYIGLCSQYGAMYIKAITIEWAENDTPTGLQKVEAVKATKALVNGQVVIFRGDKRFNLVGAKF